MSLAELLDQLDRRADIRGRQFERICKWYLQNAPEYRGRFRKVWLWPDWPDPRAAADAGIDLVAQQHDGDLWAIQAKAYDQSYAITKRDVDTFLAEAGRFDFSYRLVIATTDRLGARAKRTLDDQRVPAGYRLRSQLELSQVDWPASPDDLRPRRPDRKKPFPHVREAIRDTVTGFERTDRGQLIMACGTGKTLAAMWISERLDATRTLILVPSLSLLAQTLREWSANATEPFEYLAVCSDETVTDEDQFVAHTAELGLPVTTDPEHIAAFLRRRGRRVVFATFQSSPQIAAAYSGRTPQFDLAIADEAHRCAGRISNDFATILDGEQIKARQRLFMTATPRFYTQRVRRGTGLRDVEIASMDDKAVFGPVLHRLTFGAAIERDLLSDYQVVVVGVTDSMYRRWAERGEFVTTDGKRDTDARSLAGQIGLAKTMRKYDLHRIVSFHGRVNRAREFSAEMPDVIAWMPPQSRPGGPLWSEHVSGAMTSGHRDRLLLRFRNLASGERGLLSNARCLSEGVDVPSIDGVAFIDPRRSTIDIIQALGRAIRKASDKKVGTIVIPVFVDEQGDPEQALDSSAFKHVWDVLKALRAHDEQLAEELDELRRRLGALRAPQGHPGKLILDVSSEKVGADFARAFDVRLVEQTTATWEFWYGLLQRFVEREGHARIRAKHREDDFPLGSWVSNQRAFFGRGQIDTARRQRLEQVEGWTWDALEAEWEEGFAQLRTFVEREGHARVPAKWREDDYGLGTWVEVQRRAFGRGTIGSERRARLEAVPGWVWDPQCADWQEGFERLEAFVAREGHTRVPRRHRERGHDLATWILSQRQAYRGGSLAKGRVARLESVPGWTWAPREAVWEEGFAHLERFIEREGHSRVPSGHRDDSGFRLGDWAAHQRASRGHGQLSTERVRRLEALPGWVWDQRQASWEDAYERLRRYSEREGHAPPYAYRDVDGFRLGHWVTTQRRQRRALSGDRVRRLEALPGWTWEAHKAAWEEGFAHLEKFVEREGHGRVPHGHNEEGYALGHWVGTQRRFLMRGKLDHERRSRLEAIPGWAWDTRQEAWEEGFEHLLRFADRDGHSRVPQSYRDAGGYALGRWVHKQRQAFRQGTLDRERRARLEALPGWTWEPRKAGAR